jgi:hypothetical protein
MVAAIACDLRFVVRCSFGDARNRYIWLCTNGVGYALPDGAEAVDAHTEHIQWFVEHGYILYNQKR